MIRSLVSIIVLSILPAVALAQNYPVFQPRGPQVNPALFGNAATQGMQIGNSFQNPYASAIRGSMDGYTWGQQMRLRQQQIESMQRENAIRAQQLESMRLQNELLKRQLSAQRSGSK